MSQEAKPEEQPPQQQVVTKIRKERNSGENHEYLVLFEGSDDKNGTWVKASTVTDPAILAAFEKLKVQREKQKQHRLEKKAEKEKQEQEAKEHEAKEQKENEEQPQQAAAPLPMMPQTVMPIIHRIDISTHGNQVKKDPRVKLENIYGLARGDCKENFVFYVKRQDGPVEEMTLGQLRAEHPLELIDFFTKKLVVEAKTGEN